MKSNKNIVFDILQAQGVEIERDDITDAAIDVLDRFSRERWDMGHASGYTDASYTYGDRTENF